MRKCELFTYLGENGTVTTSIRIPGVPCVIKYSLEADKGKILTNGHIQAYTQVVPERELPNWYEINDPAKNE